TRGGCCGGLLLEGFCGWGFLFFPILVLSLVVLAGFSLGLFLLFFVLFPLGLVVLVFFGPWGASCSCFASRFLLFPFLFGSCLGLVFPQFLCDAVWVLCGVGFLTLPS